MASHEGSGASALGPDQLPPPTRYVPLVVVASADVIAKLRPTIDAVAAQIERDLQSDIGTTLRLNGWTFEMLAWGKVLAAVASDDIEIELHP